jgi:hypothetical protein
MNVRQHASLSNSDVSQKFVQFLIVPNGQLEMARDDTRLLVVTGGISSQFKDFGSEIF